MGYDYPPTEPGYQQQPPPRPRNTLGIIALIAGILAVVLCCVWAGVWAGIPAIVLGILHIRRTRAGSATASGLGIAGLVLGVFALVVTVIALIIWGVADLGQWQQWQDEIQQQY